MAAALRDLSEEELAAAWVREENAGNFDSADTYEDEFFRRRREAAGNDYDPEEVMDAWHKLGDLVDAKLSKIAP